MERKVRVDKTHVFVVLTVFFALFARWLTRRHFLPGNWLGDEQMFPMWPIIASIALFYFSVNAVQLLWSMRKRAWAVALAVLALAPSAVRWPLNAPEFRFRVERAHYRSAITQNTRFGDQFEEESRGRKLTYWRWMSWGIDDAVGIVYDPLDKLNAENREDQTAFRGPTGGVMLNSERLEPCWYFVVHS